MKVLFDGTRHIKPGTMIVKCTAEGYGGKGCGSLLRISAEDIYCSTVSNYKFEYHFQCPCCKKKSIISEKIPHDIKKSVERPISEINYFQCN